MQLLHGDGKLGPLLPFVSVAGMLISSFGVPLSRVALHLHSHSLLPPLSTYLHLHPTSVNLLIIHFHSLLNHLSLSLSPPTVPPIYLFTLHLHIFCLPLPLASTSVHPHLFHLHLIIIQATSLCLTYIVGQFGEMICLQFIDKLIAHLSLSGWIKFG